VRAMIGRESKFPSGYHRRKSFRAPAEPGKALRARGLVAKPESHGTADDRTAGYKFVTAHRRKS
jgi:hypothetical protein